VRPTSIGAKVLATLETMTPTRKRMMHTVKTGIRPKIWDRAAKGGWKTAELRRKLVPVQNASIALPRRLSAIN
jgi:hypothetical protein